MPLASSRSFAVASLRASWTAARSFAEISGSSPAGPAIRNQLVATTLGKPLSLKVGTAGVAVMRSAEERPRPRRLPARMAAALAPTVSQSPVVLPDSTACCASPAPRKGTCSSCTPASMPKSTPVRWPSEPTPEEPKLTSSAPFFAAAM